MAARYAFAIELAAGRQDPSTTSRGAVHNDNNTNLTGDQHVLFDFPNPGALHLPLAGPLAEVPIDFDDLADPGGSNRVPLRFQTSGDVDRQFSA